jgi:hypothetical protein
MFQKLFTRGLLLCLVAANSLNAATLGNLGLVGMGRIPGNSIDANGQDTLGGVFSAMNAPWDSVNGNDGVWSFVVNGQPDRGFGATADYHPRLHRFDAQITPYYGAAVAAQNQIALALQASSPYTVASEFFTGAAPDDLSFQMFPRSLQTTAGLGKLSLDPEGVALLATGERYVCEEYGPFVIHFSPQGELLHVLTPPAAYLAKVGAAYPRPNNFLAVMNPATDSGRFENRGFEGVTVSPDGTRLFTILQSALVQDGASKNASRNTRVLVFDIAPGSPSYNQPIAEYVYRLTLNGNATGTRATVVSDILALTETEFLIVERDAIGMGGDAGPSFYKSIVLASTVGATDILGTGYDLERGAPGQISLPRADLPASIQPMSRVDVINLLDPAQLGRFGMSNSAVRDANSVTEKWEGLSIVRLGDPDAPEDFLLLVGNDNDFAATPTIHNGEPVGSAPVVIDTMVMAWRIGQAPYLRVEPAFSLPVDANCSAALPDMRNRVAIIDHTAPSLSFTVVQTPAPGTVLTPGTYTVSFQAQANNGFTTTASTQLIVRDETAPVFQVATTDKPVIWPPNNQLVAITISALVTDNCDSAPTWRVVSVTNNETGAADSAIIAPNRVLVRAAREGSGSGRIYTVTLEATDASGNVSHKSVTVLVSHDQSE